MSQPVVTVAKENSLRPHEEDTMSVTHPHLGGTGVCDYKQLTSLTLCNRVLLDIY